MQTDRENHISTEASPLEIMLKVGRAITNITQVVNKIQSVSDAIRENCMNQQVIQLRYLDFSRQHKAVLWIEPQYKQVLNDHDKLCVEYRKLDDDVREIKGHLESFVHNLTPSVVSNSNQANSSSSSNSNKSNPLPRRVGYGKIKDIARISKTPKNSCYFCARPHHAYRNCRLASQAQKNLITKLLLERKYDFVQFNKRVKKQIDFQQRKRAEPMHKPAGTSIEKVSSIQNWINDLPSRITDYLKVPDRLEEDLDGTRFKEGGML